MSEPRLFEERVYRHLKPMVRGTGEGRYKIATPFITTHEAGGMGFASVPREQVAGTVPTIFVASANALEKTQTAADFVCDGLDDQVEMNAALRECPPGGRVLLSEGGFTNTGPVNQVPAERVSISGLGGLTQIHIPLNTPGTWPIFGGSDGWTGTTIERLKLSCASGSGAHAAIGLNQFSDLKIRHVLAENMTGPGFEFSYGNVFLFDSVAYGCVGIGFRLAIQASSSHVEGCRAISCGSHGIWAAVSSVYHLVVDNRVVDCGGDGIRVGGYVIVDDNTVRGCSGRGIAAEGPAGFAFVRDNTVENVGSHGVFMHAQGYGGYPQSLMEGNGVYRAGGDGLRVDGGSHGVGVIGNTVRESTGCGLYIWSGVEETYVDANDLLNAGNPVLCDNSGSTQYGTNRLASAGAVTKSAKGSVIHGTDPYAARPGGHASVEWIGSVEPYNAQDNDTWIDTSVATV